MILAAWFVAVLMKKISKIPVLKIEHQEEEKYQLLIDWRNKK